MMKIIKFCFIIYHILHSIFNSQTQKNVIYHSRLKVENNGSDENELRPEWHFISVFLFSSVPQPVFYVG